MASFENIDLPLLRKIARTGKPIIMSTGMATLSELDEAVRAIRETGGNDIALLKAVSAYPAPPEEMKEMAAAIPGAEFVAVANAGHMAPLEASTAAGSIE